MKREYGQVDGATRKRRYHDQPQSENPHHHPDRSTTLPSASPRTSYSGSGRKRLFLAYLMGVFTGVVLGNSAFHGMIMERFRRISSSSPGDGISHSTENASRSSSSSYVKHLDEIQEQPTSHQGVWKRPFLSPSSVSISPLTGCSVATLTPGQIIDPHVHPTMLEVFYVLEGHCQVQVQRIQPLPSPHDNSTLQRTVVLTEELAPGTFFLAAPNQTHSFHNTNRHQNFTMFYCGIATNA